MAKANIPQHHPIAIPCEIRSQIFEGHGLVNEIIERDAPNHIELVFAGIDFRRARSLDLGRGAKFHFGKRPAQAEGIEQRLQLQTAARLKLCLARLAAPAASARKAARAIVPAELRQTKLLVFPFQSGKNILRLVIAADNSLSTQRRLDARVFELREIPEEVHLQMRCCSGKAKLL